jgi:hypothetical protein
MSESMSHMGTKSIQKQVAADENGVVEESVLVDHPKAKRRPRGKLMTKALPQSPPQTNTNQGLSIY